MSGHQSVDPVRSMGDYDPALALDVLCDHRLEPFFRLPDRRGTNSAWWGHVPFAGWLVKATCPRTIVELGSFSGVSYSAFCQAVLFEGLDCACHAVDTWRGDVHSGAYNEDVYESFRCFHDAHYQSISTLHRCSFDDALGDFQDGTVDILHIDGTHTYEAVKHDFESWLPKLSTRCVVLFHDAAEHIVDFGVWRLWDEVSTQWPSFLFPHSHGLGILAVGADIPVAVQALCAKDDAQIALLQDRFKLLGDRWYAQAQWEVTAARATAAEASQDIAVARAVAAEAEKEAISARVITAEVECNAAIARAIAAEAEKEAATTRAIVAEAEKEAATTRAIAAEAEKEAEIARAAAAEAEREAATKRAITAEAARAAAVARAIAAEAESETVTARANASEAENARLGDAEARLIAIESSTSWRATALLRSTGARFPGISRLIRRGIRAGR